VDEDVEEPLGGGVDPFAAVERRIDARVSGARLGVAAQADLRIHLLTGGRVRRLGGGAVRHGGEADRRQGEERRRTRDEDVYFAAHLGSIHHDW
jgi:hypothetical protein